MAIKKSTSRAKVKNKPKSRVATSFRSAFKLNPGIIAILAGTLILIGGFWVLLSQAATPFRHPGVLVSKEQLDFVKGKVAAGQEPWTSAFNKMKSSFLASKTYTPKPVVKLQCTTSGLLNAYQQIGCTDINNDSAAVYTQALMWRLTGDQAYANKAIQIMNAWSFTLKEAPLDDPSGSDPRNDAEFWQSRLILGWSAETMIRGAEIIRYSNVGWQQADIDRFESMLRNIYYPHLAEGWTGAGNGAASWASGLINMGVFLRDDAIYEKGIQHWKQNSRSMVYLTKDGDKPLQYLSPRDNKNKIPNYWTVTSYINGLESETCRDLGHTFMGLGAMTNGAETALLHGRHDLYSDPEFKERFIAGYELNARYANEVLDYMAANNIKDTSLFDENPNNNPRNPALASWKPANFPCGDFKVGGGSTYLGSEIAYNHFANRLGISMPNTKKLVERTRPQNGGNHLFYEALTHANTGSVGLPVASTSTVIPSPTSTVTASPVPSAPVETVAPSPSSVPSPSPSPTTTSTPAPTPTTTPAPTSDTVRPSTPSGIKASLVFDPTRFSYYANLTWGASYDNVGITSYEIKRNNTSLGTSTSLNFKDYTVQPNILYTYDIYARDAAGNVSLPGATRLTGRCFLIWCWSE